MEMENQSHITEFILLGLRTPPGQKELCFMLFLALYLVTIAGNLLIILAIGSDSHLHSPMYFFLANLSCADICFSSITVPKMLVNMQTDNPAISYTGCLSQIFFILLFGDLDNFLLAVMAYDRYVAICQPLSYVTTMSIRLSALIVVTCWVLTAVHALLHTLLVARLSFCTDRVIPHFFCDLSTLVHLSCSDISVNKLVIITVGAAVVVGPFLGILVSYTHIFCTVLRVPSARGLHRGISTCGSHLAVVSLFYGTVIGLYLCPSPSHSAEQGTVVALLYTVVTPLLNPFIYSLRNRALLQTLCRTLSTFCRRKTHCTGGLQAKRAVNCMVCYALTKVGEGLLNSWTYIAQRSLWDVNPDHFCFDQEEPPAQLSPQTLLSCTKGGMGGPPNKITLRCDITANRNKIQSAFDGVNHLLWESLFLVAIGSHSRLFYSPKSLKDEPHGHFLTSEDLPDCGCKCREERIVNKNVRDPSEILDDDWK
ncbi:olfactory receptor 1468-like [Tachyglossus aculeatus]|uniref:olfactory receptor 1468-like n=1 Tax=Tachyglossus aculeatus TaxID=9261 RepID=UPI0018F462AF|nr:olfactory receptor 1468-like [Tachyglossus aculeatus]